MPALNFQKRFVADVESGKKPHTIRPMRKRPFRVGDRLYLKTGQQTKHCRSFGETDCTRVDGIRIYSDDRIVIVNGLPLQEKSNIIDKPLDIESLALNDGFKDVDSFFEFFGPRYNFDFQGQIIWWDPEKIER